ncbi:SGNH/GDSL hydrolase family protein [Mangrovicoccus algicola]|uniref:SGNH/GDSL hydrolase family protein n=1 Tax=Mangrovicoccus algicola TaxID=2771008 RepID=A0A8J6YX96_9RHOB|nr:SGNH/GDSL hydrolase family protein [Mangrovicoccus algicola]MBE3639505.1 SGNH/GDSL hydrolase family protein [Mangrovicoccus algicola]
MKREWRRFAVLAGLVLGMLAGLVAGWKLQTPPPPGDRPIAPLSLSAMPERPVRIVAFGSSLTRSSPWPVELEGELADCLDHPVEVLRIARSGAGSAWGLQAVNEVVAAGPDLVLVEFAINDADLLDGVSLRRGKAQHAALIARLQETVAPGHVVLLTMNPVGGLHAALRAPLARHYAQLGELADRHGAALADLYGDWMARPAAQRRFADGLHPAPHQVRQVVLPGLVRRIGMAAGRACMPG